jgi:hypothetical protein
LEAKQITVKDKKRLSRLKKKAEGGSETPEKVEEPKTAIKYEILPGSE